MRAPSVVSSKAGSVAASLPSMRAVSISSSAHRRRDLLMERHEELQAQLALVEEMLQQNKPTTMMTQLSGFSAVSGRTAASGRSAVSGRTAASGRSAATELRSLYSYANSPGK